MLVSGGLSPALLVHKFSGIALLPLLTEPAAEDEQCDFD
jgi:hypothetical protein